MMELPVVVLDCMKLENLNSGLGQFCLNLGKNLAQTNEQRFDLHFLVPSKSKGVFGAHVKYLLPEDKSHLSKNISVLHLTHQDSKFFCAAKKTIITIHDLNFLYKYGRLKRLFRTFQLKTKVGKADFLAFISSFSKKEFLKHLPFPEQNTRIIYNGLCTPEPAESRINLKSQRPFFFNLGIVSEKKNIHVLIPLLKFFPEMDLVIAGNNKSTYAKKLVQLSNDQGYSERIFFTGEINEKEKSWYYENCQAFLFPSISEGFGLPVIEAFYFGKPVFCSAFTSLPEVGGDLAFYWDSFEPEGMANTIKAGLSKWTTELASQANRRALSFSWKHAAEAYLQLYADLLNLVDENNPEL